MIDAYRARGWVPVPVRPGEKRPAEPSWQTRTLDSAWPAGEWDVGIVLGAASGGLIDIDLDCPEAVAFAPALLPRTAAFGHRPERGHMLYLCPEIRKRETYGHDGMIVEVRADDCQTVAPPSGGRRWAEPWVEPLAIDAAELRRRVGALAALVLVARHWPRGGRHEAQLALAGTLLAEGWTEEETLEALCVVCRLAGDEDRAKREATVRRTAERVAACEEVTGWGTLASALPPEVAKVARGWLGSKRVETVSIESLKSLADTLVRGNDRKKKDLGKLLRHVAGGDRVAEDVTELARVVGKAYPDADVEALANTFARSTDRNVRGVIEKGQREAQERAHVEFERGSGAELAKRVNAVLGRKGELAYDEGRLWRSEPSLWTTVAEAEVDAATMSFDGAPLKDGGMLKVGAQDVLAVRKTLLPSLAARPSWFSDAPAGVAFQGHFVGASGVEVLTPEHRCRAAYAWPWDETAECPAWMGFLRETYGDDSDVPAFLAEFAGACLLGVATRFQKFLVLFGDGETGKSQVVRVLTGIMPAGSVASIAPHDWREKYSRARLVGVRLNAVSEMPSTELFDSESIKAIVAGDAIEAREPYGRPFDLHATAGHVFAANELPPVRDMSRGFWRRVVVVTHERVPTSKVPGLAELILEEELPGIVRWAIEGGRRAIERGAYALPSNDAVDLWRIESDTVALWLRDRCVPGGPTTTSDCYEDYRYSTMAGGQKPVSMVVFGKRMTRLGCTGGTRVPPVHPVMMGTKDARMRGWSIAIRGR